MAAHRRARHSRAPGRARAAPAARRTPRASRRRTRRGRGSASRAATSAEVERARVALHGDVQAEAVLDDRQRPPGEEARPREIQRRARAGKVRDHQVGERRDPVGEPRAAVQRGGGAEQPRHAERGKVGRDDASAVRGSAPWSGPSRRESRAGGRAGPRCRWRGSSGSSSRASSRRCCRPRAATPGPPRPATPRATRRGRRDGAAARRSPSRARRR